MSKNQVARWWKLTRTRDESKRKWARRMSALDPTKNPKFKIAIMFARKWLHGKREAQQPKAIRE